MIIIPPGTAATATRILAVAAVAYLIYRNAQRLAELRRYRVALADIVRVRAGARVGRHPHDVGIAFPARDQKESLDRVIVND